MAMKLLLSSCPSCRRVGQFNLENLGRKSRCPCGTTFELAEWKCLECGQPLKKTLSQCPKCLSDIESPELSCHSSGLENGGDPDTADREDEFNEDQQNIPDSSNVSDNDDLALEFLNESVEQGIIDKEEHGVTQQSDVSTHQDRWRQEQELAYAREQELMAEKARLSRERLRHESTAERRSNPVDVQQSSPVNKTNGEKHKRCPMCAELIQYEAKICRFCKSDLSSAKATANTADDTYGYAIIALLIGVISLLWCWFPTLRLIDNPAGKLQIVMLLMWCGNGLLVYKDASNLGVEAKANKSAALWALYAFIIPIVAIPHWLAYRQQLGGTRMFLWGFILTVVVAASVFHWSFAINNQVGEFQRRLQDLQNL